MHWAFSEACRCSVRNMGHLAIILGAVAINVGELGPYVTHIPAATIDRPGRSDFSGQHTLHHVMPL